MAKNYKKNFHFNYKYTKKRPQTEVFFDVKAVLLICNV